MNRVFVAETMDNDNDPELLDILAQPTMDLAASEVESKSFEYGFYDRDKTFVISGPCTPFGKERHGGRYMTRAQARAWTKETYGTVYEEYVQPHRWAIRVKKPTVDGGRYTPPAESPVHPAELNNDTWRPGDNYGKDAITYTGQVVTSVQAEGDHRAAA